VAAGALAKGASGISGDKLEHLLKKLLVQHRNISFEPVGGPFETKKSSKPQLLTEDLANDMFCGDVQDMFILAFDVIKSNYSGFFEKLGNLFGDHIGAFKTLINGFPVHRVGDAESHGGIQAEGSSTVFANGIAIARVGDMGAVGEPIPPFHAPNPEATGSPNVFAEG